ncbi:MAG: WG repeat-containing protein [Candidatus Gastranaerophilales bacterium]|nr:WG repeat-containing protein [Candidatus Gastranaerophilales bacterium]
MKKIFIILALLLTVNSVQAHPRHYNYGYGYSGCSNCVYLLKSDFYQKTQTLPDCEDHSILIDTTINYYSNGAKRTYSTYSVVDNKKETIILSDYLDIKHVLVNNKHYFLAKNGREYKILNGKGHVIGSRQYSTMKEIAPNRFLVSINKLYGIIDINENIIAPIKYKSIEQLNKNLFMTKLNGYYGLIDSSNNVFLKNEYDKIKPLYDTYVAKRKNKYALVDFNGNKILDCEYDKIKKLGEYIIIKKGRKYGVLDSQGKAITHNDYKKVKLERNQLLLYKDGHWESI